MAQSNKQVGQSQSVYPITTVLPHVDKPKVVSRSQKSKADDLVLIKIAMNGQQQHIYGEILRHIGRISLHYSKAK